MILFHLAVQWNFVVSCNNYFVFELEIGKYFDEILKMLFSSISREISCMNEDIPFLVLSY